MGRAIGRPVFFLVSPGLLDPAPIGFFDQVPDEANPGESLDAFFGQAVCLEGAAHAALPPSQLESVGCPVLRALTTNSRFPVRANFCNFFLSTPIDQAIN